MLVDNNTFIDQYYLGEPAASFYIEDGDTRILFDAGYSDILISNAEKMGIDLQTVTHIVLSHGHDDHTRGIKFLEKHIDMSAMQLIAHPECFLPKYSRELYIGAPYCEDEMKNIANYIPARSIYQVSEKIIYLGEIPRTTEFENKSPVGKYMKNGELTDDYMIDDTALVYKGEKGLFIITGCSHSGICNIIEYAKKVCGSEKIYGVLGGFHLFADNEQLRETIHYFEKNHIEKLYPCHCVSLLARAMMMKKLPVVETGVGLVVEVE